MKESRGVCQGWAGSGGGSLGFEDSPQVGTTSAALRGLQMCVGSVVESSLCTRLLHLSTPRPLDSSTSQTFPTFPLPPLPLSQPVCGGDRIEAGALQVIPVDGVARSAHQKGIGLLVMENLLQPPVERNASVEVE